MKRLVLIAAFLACLPAAGVAPAAGQQASPGAAGGGSAGATERLLELHLEWRGGREALAALTFLERRGDIRIGDNEGTFRTVGGRDGWLRYDGKIDEVQQVEAVTPHGGWRWVNGNLSDLPGDRIDSFRTSIDEMFARHLLLEKGYTARHVGRESKEGTEYEVLRLSNGDGSIDLFLDGADGSLHWTREPEDGAPAWTRLDDWRTVDGVRFAFRSDRRPDEAARRQLTEWKDIAPRGALDAGEFYRPPERSGTLDFDADAATTPFDLYLDGYIELPGEVRGHDVRVMLDSGAGITVLDRSFAREIGLALRDAGTIQGVGGEERLFLAQGVDVAIPGVTLRDATVAVLDMSEIYDKLGRSFEVVLGIELFTRSVVTVDYPARTLTVAPPHPYEPPPGAGSVRMLSRGGIPTVVCRFEQLPATLCDIDTGSNSSVDIVAHYVDEYDMLSGRPAVSQIATGGVGGMLQAPISTLQEFSFAGVSVGPSPANFMAEAVGSLDTEEIAGNIGAAVLQEFALVFDYPGMRFHVIPPPDRKPVRRDRSGVQSSFRGDHLEIYNVAPGSPAERAGLRAAQRITAIDGRRIEPDYLEGGFRWAYGAAGTTVVLTDDLGREYPLVLADYF